jgi:autotransporter-associated beta strand protein
MVTDITSQILADGGADDIAMTGDNYVVSLEAGTTATYSGALTGTGTLDVSGSGSTLILTGDSTFGLSGAAEWLSTAYITSAYFNYDGYTSTPMHGTVYTLHGNDSPAITIDAGSTLQLGKTSSSNGAGTSTAGDPGSIFKNIGLSGYNMDNIEVNGTLRVEYTSGVERLGMISGIGNVVFDVGGQGELDGANTFSGTLVSITGLTIGSDHIAASIDNVKAIFNNGSLILDTPFNNSMEIKQNIYENHYGSDVNIDGNGGQVTLSGVYSYTDSSNDNPVINSNTDYYTLNPSLSNASSNYTVLKGNSSGRGINVEGAIVQFGNGTTTNWVLPGNIDNTYINLHGGGIIGLDYSNGGPTYDNTVIAGGGLSFHSLDAAGSGTVVFKQGDIVITQQQYYNGTTQIDSGATAQLGDGTQGDKTTTAAGLLYETSGGDGNFLMAGQTVTIASGSTSTGSSTNKLINNGTLIIDNTGSTELLNLSGAGTLIQAGSGVTTLESNSIYTGSTLIYSGTLAIGSTGSIATSSGVSLYASGNPAESPRDASSTVVTKGAATFDISEAGNQTIVELSGDAGTYLYLGANTLTIGDSSSTIYGGVIADGGVGAGGGLTKIGSGTLTLSGTETYTGATDIQAGTLAVTGSIASSGVVELANSGTVLNLSNASNRMVKDLKGVSGTSILLDGHTLVASNDTDTAFAGTISDGGVEKQGSKTLALSGNSVFHGGITVDAGTLSLEGASHLFGNLSVASGATADLSATQNLYLNDLVGASGSTLLLGNGTLTAAQVHNRSFGGTIEDGTKGAGGLQKRGTATLQFAGHNTYTGGTVVQGGTLDLVYADSAGTGTVAFAANTTATLKVETTGFTNQIDGFGSLDTLLLGGFTAGDAISASYDSSTGYYTVADTHGQKDVLHLTSASHVGGLNTVTVNGSGYISLYGAAA